MRKPCRIKECDRHSSARGWCGTHYARWLKHGDPTKGVSKNESHGLTGTSEYRSWQKMKERCYNPTSNRYANYGGRGIKVCDRWRESFTAFLSDMGNKPTPGHSIDRLDVNGHYQLNNCRWANSTEQANNTRSTKFLTYGNKTMSVSDWARKMSMKPFTLHQRIRVYRWSTERALTTPVRRIKT